MIFKDYEPSHFMQLQFQDHQLDMESFRNEQFAENLGKGKIVYAAFDANTGIINAIGGLTYLWGKTGESWIFIDRRIDPKKFIKLHNFIKKVYDDSGLERIQATVDCNFEQGIRLVESLEMQQEGILKRYWINGQDHYMYGRIKCL